MSSLNSTSQSSSSLSNSLLYLDQDLSVYWDAKNGKKTLSDKKAKDIADLIFSVVGLCDFNQFLSKHFVHLAKARVYFLVIRDECVKKCSDVARGLYETRYEEIKEQKSNYKGVTPLNICKSFFNNHPMPILFIQILMENQLLPDTFKAVFYKFVLAWDEEDKYYTDFLFKCLDLGIALPVFGGVDPKKFAQFLCMRSVFKHPNKQYFTSWYSLLIQWVTTSDSSNHRRVNELLKRLNLPLAAPQGTFESDFADIIKKFDLKGEEKQWFGFLSTCLDLRIAHPSLEKIDCKKFTKFLESRFLAPTLRNPTTWHALLFQWLKQTTPDNHTRVNWLLRNLNLREAPPQAHVKSFLHYLISESISVIRADNLLSEDLELNLRRCMKNEAVRKRIFLTRLLEKDLILPTVHPQAKSVEYHFMLNQLLAGRNELSVKLFDHPFSSSEWATIYSEINSVPLSKIPQAALVAQQLLQSSECQGKVYFSTIFGPLLKLKNLQDFESFFLIFFNKIALEPFDVTTEKALLNFIERCQNIENFSGMIHICSQIRFCFAREDDENLLYPKHSEKMSYPLYYWVDLFFRYGIELPGRMAQLQDQLADEVIQEFLKIPSEYQPTTKYKKFKNEWKLYFKQLFFDYFVGNFSFGQIKFLKDVSLKLSTDKKMIKIQFQHLSAIEERRKAFPPKKTSPLAKKLNINVERKEKEAEGKEIDSANFDLESGGNLYEERAISSSSETDQPIEGLVLTSQSCMYNNTPSTLSRTVESSDSSHTLSMLSGHEPESITPRLQEFSITISSPSPPDLSKTHRRAKSSISFSSFTPNLAPIAAEKNVHSSTPKFPLPLSEASTQSKTVTQLDFIRFLSEKQNDAELVEIFEKMSACIRVLAENFPLSDAELTSIFFAYMPFNNDFHQWSLVETLVEMRKVKAELENSMEMLEGQYQLLKRIKALVNHQLPQKLIFTWMMYAPEIERTNHILEHLSKDMDKLKQHLGLIATEEGIAPPVAFPLICSTIVKKLNDRNPSGYAVTNSPSLVKLKSSKLGFDYRAFFDEFAVDIVTLSREISFATVPISFQHISDCLDRRQMNVSIETTIKTNRLTLLSKGLKTGIAFYIDWEMQDDKKPPVMILSVLNLTTYEATVSHFKLPYTLEEIIPKASLMDELHAAGIKLGENESDGDSKETKFSKTATQFIETIKRNHHFCLVFLAQKGTEKFAIKPWQTEGCTGNYLCFDGEIKHQHQPHLFNFQSSVPISLQLLIPDIERTIKNSLFAHKQSFPFSTASTLHHSQYDQLLELEFNPVSDLNVVILKIGPLSQKVHYLNLIHEPHFTKMLQWQLMLVVEKRYRLSRQPLITEGSNGRPTF